MQPSNQRPIASGSRSSRVRRTALAVALGGGLALGVAGLAYADDASAPPAPPAPSGGAPAAAPSGSAPAGPAPAGSAPAGPAPAGPGGAKAQHRPHLDGVVQQLLPGKIMIVDRDGFTRQINTTSVPDGVVAGTRVHAEGAVDADGVSLDATSVVVAPAHVPGGPKNGARPAPGPKTGEGKGAPGVPAPRESGAPTAPGGSVAPPGPSPTS